MPKRKRSNYNDNQRYGKRSRRFTVSPSIGDDIITDHAAQLRTLQLELDILRAQIVILRREIDELNRKKLKGEKVKKRTCLIM